MHSFLSILEFNLKRGTRMITKANMAIIEMLKGIDISDYDISFVHKTIYKQYSYMVSIPFLQNCLTNNIYLKQFA